MMLLAAVLALSVVQTSVEQKTCVAPDGVRIAYSVAGSGDTALVFVHGALANRTFYDAQLRHFLGRYRVIALDLGGHGESGTNRKAWSIPLFGADVKAVADAERLERMVLFGNSIAGPIVVEAALLMPGRVVGVVGIDTLQDVGEPWTPEQAALYAKHFNGRATGFKTDHSAALKGLLKSLLHPDTDPALVASIERRMAATPPAVAYETLRTLADYNPTAAPARLAVPLRAINGDLYPTDVPAIRRVKSDFEAIIMPRVGHYPMLEQPAAFNKHIETMLAGLLTRK